MKGIVSKFIHHRDEGEEILSGINWNKGLCWYFHLKVGRFLFYLRVPRRIYKKELAERYRWRFDFTTLPSKNLLYIDLANNTITLWGVKYSMEVFLTLTDPDPNKVYQFMRKETEVQLIEVSGFPIPKR
jgi:hypothetical protein